MNRMPLPIFPHYRILNSIRTNNCIKATIMIPIDESEESMLDDINDNTSSNIKNEIFQFNRGNRTFSVSIKDIYCYGNLNFNDDNVIKEIEEFNFLDYLTFSGIPIRSRYDYITHSCVSIKQKPLWVETWSTLDLVKLAHGYLGKPERILLFKQIIK